MLGGCGQGIHVQPVLEPMGEERGRIMGIEVHLPRKAILQSGLFEEPAFKEITIADSTATPPSPRGSHRVLLDFLC